jgi:hypothetical protein
MVELNQQIPHNPQLLKILDESPGFGARIDERKLKDFLTTKILNLHLRTVDQNGHSDIHPVE